MFVNLACRYADKPETVAEDYLFTERLIHKVTGNEVGELLMWIDSGHSPYDNPWGILEDDRKPAHFITALRLTRAFLPDYIYCHPEWTEDSTYCDEQELPF